VRFVTANYRRPGDLQVVRELLNILTGLSFEGFCFGPTAVSIPDRARSILLQSANVQSQVSGVDEAPSFDSPNGRTEHQF
jgi:hypothetical protein